MGSYDLCVDSCWADMCTNMKNCRGLRDLRLSCPVGSKSLKRVGKLFAGSFDHLTFKVSYTGTGIDDMIEQIVKNKSKRLPRLRKILLDTPNQPNNARMLIERCKEVNVEFEIVVDDSMKWTF